MHNVSFTLKKGDFATLIGSNGSGKSTLLNCIAGVYLADRGSIIIDGMDMTKLCEHKRAAVLGRVFQDPIMGTASNMGIEENLALALRRGQCRGLAWGITNREREHYRNLLKKLGLGLENRLSIKVGLLSGGQRQALTLLMATLKKPKLWDFYRLRFFIFLLTMIVMGNFISRHAHGNYSMLVNMALIEISLATALLGSSFCFWKKQG